jgi:CRISPR-associated protein Cmr4
VKTVVLGLLAETPIHPGGGRSLGVVDLPVAREAATDYPVLVGSALKGALRDRIRAGRGDEGKELASRRFGEPDQAGELLVSDGRLLLLPVRSLTGASQWVTCPQLIERYRRDLARAGEAAALPEVPPELDAGRALAATVGELFLEERQFQVDAVVDPAIAPALGRLLPHPEVRQRLARRLVIVNDDDFGWFARYGLPITARNQLDTDTKQSKNLWYEETLPPDTVMYMLVSERRDGALDTVREAFPDYDRYLQAGGNETVGQGWFAVGFPTDVTVSA